jgi:predicted transcriptional regulator
MRIKPVALIALRRLVGKRRVSQKDKERLFGWSSRCGKQSNAVTIPASPIMPRYATPDAIPAGAWMVTGPFFSYSDTWQLVMNTWTDVATFLMVFLIQNSQNRDSSALQAKLDELIRTSAARNSFVGIEKLTPEEIETIRQSVEALARQRSDGR